jgi:hypothetical protein
MSRRWLRATMGALALACASLLLPPRPARAADKPIQMADVPKAVQETMRAESKGAKIVGTLVETENGKKLYELETIVQGHGRDLLIDPTGHVVEVEVQMDPAAVPQAVQEAIQKYSAGAKTTKIESVARGDGKVFAYEVHMQKDGKTHGFRVAPDGKLLPEDEE